MGRWAGFLLQRKSDLKQNLHFAITRIKRKQDVTQLQPTQAFMKDRLKCLKKL